MPMISLDLTAARKDVSSKKEAGRYRGQTQGQANKIEKTFMDLAALCVQVPCGLRKNETVSL
jgi:hypothetical protein